MTVKSFVIEGYRSIQQMVLPLTRINVITGANGCGKSNLYKALLLVAQASQGRLAQVLSLEGGMPSVLWAGPRPQLTRTKKPIRMALGFETDQYNYLLTCGLPIPSLSKFCLDPEVKEEYVWLTGKRRPSNTLLERKASSAWLLNQDNIKTSYPMHLSQSESVLSQLQEPHLYPELFALKMALSEWRFYHYFRTDLAAPLRQAQIGVRTPVLSNNGQDLAAALQTIIEIGNPSLLAEMVDRAFPESKLIIVSDDKTRFEIQLQMPGLLRPLAAKELSDGTLRYLCLLAALLSPRPAPMLILNEPEMSLHPALLKPLAELITLASQKSQVIVTTHAEELARFIELKSGEAPRQLQMTQDGTVLV